MIQQDLFETSYTSNDALIDISKRYNEVDWLKARRASAYENFLNLPFDKDTLFYKYTNFRKFDPKILKPFNAIEEYAELDINSLKIGDLSPSVIETEAGILSDLDDKYIKQGVYFGSLHELILKDPSLAKKIIDDTDNYSSNFDKLGSLSQAFASNILVLYIPKGVVIDDILLKTTILSSSNVAIFSEFIGYFEEDSQVKLLEMYSSRTNNSGTNMYGSMQTMILKDNARVLSAQIQDWDKNTIHLLARTSQIGRYGNLQSFSQLQGGEMSRVNSNIDLDGTGSEGYDLFVQFGNLKQRFDIKSELHHNTQDTIGNVHARTVMMNKAESILRGLIVIPKSGVNADSWLTSQGMTIGKGKIVAIPALNIDQNEVKAAHAASVEPLNEELIFYLNSRGLPEELSKEMLIKGYFDYIHKQLKNSDIVELSKAFLSRKWEQRE